MLDYGARFYDPVIARFTTIDPMAENHHDYTPYNYTLNNPLRYTDPLGLDTVGINSSASVQKGDQIEVSEGKYVTASANDVQVTSKKPESIFDQAGKVVSDTWNSPIARSIVTDFVSIGGGFNGIAGVGAGTSFEANWVLRGPEASIFPVITTTQSIGGGFSIDATLNVGAFSYLGPASEINRGMLQTSIQDGQLTLWGSGGITAGGKIGITRSFTTTSTGYGIVGRQVNIGAGLPAGPLPVNAAGGVSILLYYMIFIKNEKIIDGQYIHYHYTYSGWYLDAKQC